MGDKHFEYQIKKLKEKYPSFKIYQDYHVFTLMCIKYFFYNDSSLDFDADNVLEYLTDGSKDGGIDAIFNDPLSDTNDVVVVQSKLYMKSKLDFGDIAAEIHKIIDTLKKLQNNKIADFNENLVTAYRNATSQMEDGGAIKIAFFTSYETKNKRELNKIEKSIHSSFKDYEIELYFNKDIAEQIEQCDNEKLYVEYDKLILDKKDNFLEYDNSIIVNVSALSLQDLQNRRRNGLLGLNLRYYVRKKDVDTAIEETIRKEPKKFWYKNNGISIVCDNYVIDGKELKLYNFSIVNGGQTTNRIGKTDIDEDFYLQCKVIKKFGESEKEKDDLVFEIAEATNAQKPIKKSDLKANTPEQLKLKERLAKHDVYYMTKKGDKVPKSYSEPYQNATLDKVGKATLATVLQMPGTARSNSKKMYEDDEIYYLLYGETAKAGIIADSLKLSYYYDKFVKTQMKNGVYDVENVVPMLKNGKTFQLASITFLSKINQDVFTFDEVTNHQKNIDDLKLLIRNTGEMKKIITSKNDNEEEIVFEIFSIIGEEVLGYCFGNALEKARDNQKDVAASDYLKLDINYYKDVIKRLCSVYNKRKSELRAQIELICGSQK